MAWEAEASATQLTAITTTEQFFDVTPQLTPAESAHVEVIVDFGGTTDDAIIAVYGSLDGTNYDDDPIMEFTLETGGTDPRQRSFTISGVYQFRVGVRSTGATDSHIADMNVREDGISL